MATVNWGDLLLSWLHVCSGGLTHTLWASKIHPETIRYPRRGCGWTWVASGAGRVEEIRSSAEGEIRQVTYDQGKPLKHAARISVALIATMTTLDCLRQSPSRPFERHSESVVV